MRKIRIIQGTYGYRKNGKGMVEAKTRTSPPFELDEKEAARLVSAGVAKFVDEVTADDDYSGDDIPTADDLPEDAEPIGEPPKHGKKKGRKPESDNLPDDGEQPDLSPSAPES